jgi:hypothetical protein
MKRLNYLELPGHIALLALDQEWLQPEHLADLGAHLRLAETLAERKGDADIATVARKAKQIMAGMNNEPGSVEEFRKLVGVTLPWVSRQNNIEIDRIARGFGDAFDKR